MPATMRLTVLTGPHKGQRYCFREPTTCLLGRSPECLVQFAGTERDLAVSRRHCLLDVDPPFVRIRDLGSLNGTFVNGHPVAPCDGCPADEALSSGDVITVGGTSLRVEIVECPPPAAQEQVWNDRETIKRDCPVACA